MNIFIIESVDTHDSSMQCAFELYFASHEKHVQIFSNNILKNISETFSKHIINLIFISAAVIYVLQSYCAIN